ncbi:hypothetical protein AAVH_31318 [Aphelenchoides avenae]|nr:hypothetical protein AAVH_31318 [Aphelenchus avenae]
MPVTTVAIAFALLVALMHTTQANSLECYETYSSGRVIKGGIFKGCDKGQSGCAKKVYNNSTVTRGCDVACNEVDGVKPYAEFLAKDQAMLYCCYSDKCNGAAGVVLAPLLLLAYGALVA